MAGELSEANRALVLRLIGNVMTGSDAEWSNLEKLLNAARSEGGESGEAVAYRYEFSAPKQEDGHRDGTLVWHIGYSATPPTFEVRNLTPLHESPLSVGAEKGRNDQAVAILRMALTQDDVGTVKAFIKAALDFATNDEEALAEGAALAPKEGDALWLK